MFKFIYKKNIKKEKYHCKLHNITDEISRFPRYPNFNVKLCDFEYLFDYLEELRVLASKCKTPKEFYESERANKRLEYFYPKETDRLIEEWR